MKKLFVVLIAAAFCFGAVSCKKNCTCEGSAKISVEGFETEQKFGPIDAGKMSKSDCEAYKYTPVGLPEGVDFKYSCKSE